MIRRALSGKRGGIEKQQARRTVRGLDGGARSPNELVKKNRLKERLKN